MGLSVYIAVYIESVSGSFRMCRFLRLLFGDAVSVDGGPVIFHGNGDPVKFFTQREHLVRLFHIAVLALRIIAAEHEGQALIRIAAGRIFRHAGIAGAVAEGQNRLIADFLGDHTDLVHFEVLDDKFTAENQLVIIVKNIIQTVYISLVFGDQRLIGTDDLPVGDMQRGIINDAANDETVGTADNVYSFLNSWM